MKKAASRLLWIEPVSPKQCPHRMPDDIAEAILELRRHHPTWGPKKLLAWLHRQWPEE